MPRGAVRLDRVAQRLDDMLLPDHVVERHRAVLERQGDVLHFFHVR